MHVRCLYPGDLLMDLFVLSESAVFGYKVDNFYAPRFEGCLLATDPELNIDWRISHEKIIMSDKDKEGKLLDYFL